MNFVLKQAKCFEGLGGTTRLNCPSLPPPSSHPVSEGFSDLSTGPEVGIKGSKMTCAVIIKCDIRIKVNTARFANSRENIYLI